MSIDADHVTQGLSGTRWTAVEVVDATGSTNADLVGRAATEAIDGIVRITTEQTAGRGRHSRVWTAPAGGQLAMSAAVEVGDETDALGWLSLIAGMAAVTAVRTVTGLTSGLKWPNDVLVDGRKVAGILSEYTPTPRGGLVVIGTGLNTDMTPEQLPVPTATSVAIASGRPAPITDLAVAYLGELAALLDRWPHDVAALADSYREVSQTIGRRVRLVLPGEQEVTGTAVDVDTHGRIVVDDDGTEVVVAAADVTHLRPIDGSSA